MRFGYSFKNAPDEDKDNNKLELLARRGSMESSKSVNIVASSSSVRLVVDSTPRTENMELDDENDGRYMKF